MPRRLATLVPQTASRLMRTPVIKSPPVWHMPVLAHPPGPSLVREELPRPVDDLPPLADSKKSRSVHILSIYSAFAEHTIRNSRRYKPRPQPIVWPEDKIRQRCAFRSFSLSLSTLCSNSMLLSRFWEDHPWEAYRGRTVVEADTLQKLRYEGKKTTDLREWTRVPSGDE
jgi:hypothetical protein